MLFRVWRPVRRHPAKNGSSTTPELDAVRSLVPALLDQIKTDPVHQAQAAYVLTLLLLSEPALQDLAVAHHAFPTVHRALSSPALPDQPYATPAALASAWRTAASLLSLLAALMSDSDAHRQRAVAANLAPALLAALSHPAPAVRAAGAHALRALSRSPHVMRTGMFGEDGGAALAGRVMGLLEGEGLGAGESVVEAGLGLVANLVLEFSPVRGELVGKGVVGVVGGWVRRGGRGVRCEALGALKNG